MTPTELEEKRMTLEFHHLHQVPVVGLSQTIRPYRPFTGIGIGIVLFRHEFSVVIRRRALISDTDR